MLVVTSCPSPALTLGRAPKEMVISRNATLYSSHLSQTNHPFTAKKQGPSVGLATVILLPVVAVSGGG